MTASPSTDLEADILRGLQLLPLDTLRSVDALISFLSGTSSIPEKQPPHEVTESLDDAESGADSATDASLAWMLRLLFGDPTVPDSEPSADTLRHRRLDDVPLIPQEQSEWCWAASTQMVLAFHQVPSMQTASAQLNIVRSVDPLLRDGLPAHRLNVTGWPPFDAWGLDAKILPSPQVLSAEQVQEEIDAQRPFVVSWHYPRQGGHMLVIAGYLWVGDDLWLAAHDPWPAGVDGGDRSLLSYEHYAEGMAGSWRTYFQIRPAGSRESAS